MPGGPGFGGPPTGHHHRVTALLWIFAAVFLLLTVVDPRSLWYATTAWQFKHPEANEPSQASFEVGRLVSGVAFAGFTVAAIATTASAVAPLTQDRLDDAGYDAAGALSGSYDKYGTPGVAQIEEALDRRGVSVSEAGSVTDDAGATFGESEQTEEYYSIVGTDDTSIAGCMEISYLGGLFHDGDTYVSASYSAGVCDVPDEVS